MWKYFPQVQLVLMKEDLIIIHFLQWNSLIQKEEQDKNTSNSISEFED